jgi:hypothetical protein
MKARILAVLRSSEFYIAVIGIVFEALHSPVPEEYKAFAWAYVGARVISKVVKVVFPA